MKKHIAFVLFLLSMTLQAQDHFIGHWATDEGGLLVEIYVQDSTYYAKTTNQNKGTGNQVVLIQMAKKSDTQLYGGTYYDVDTQSEYEAKLKLIDEHTLRLKVLSGLFSKTLFWHRVDWDWEAKAKAVTAIQH